MLISFFDLIFIYSLSYCFVFYRNKRTPVRLFRCWLCEISGEISWNFYAASNIEARSIVQGRGRSGWARESESRRREIFPLAIVKWEEETKVGCEKDSAMAARRGEKEVGNEEGKQCGWDIQSESWQWDWGREAWWMGTRGGKQSCGTRGVESFG